MKLPGILSVAIIACVVGLSGCANTVRGAGQDLKNTGEAVEDTIN